MVTVVLIIGFALAYALWHFYDKWKKAYYVAKAIDSQGASGKFITPDTQKVIDMLKTPSNLKLSSADKTIVLADGQKICYKTDDMTRFQGFSRLNYTPTDMEWEILRGIVRKLYHYL